MSMKTNNEMKHWFEDYVLDSPQSNKVKMSLSKMSWSFKIPTNKLFINGEEHWCFTAVLKGVP